MYLWFVLLAVVAIISIIGIAILEVLSYCKEEDKEEEPDKIDYRHLDKAYYDKLERARERARKNYEERKNRDKMQK